MPEPILFEGIADVESVIAGFEEIAAAAEAAAEAMSSLGAASADLSSMDDVLSALIDLTNAVTDGFASLNESLSALTEQASAAAASLAEIAAAGDGLSTVAAQEEAVNEQLGLMQGLADAASGAMEALQGAAAPLMMLSLAGGMAGKSLLDMGMQAQNALAIVQGMAMGTSDSVSNYMGSLEGMSTDLGITLDKVAQGFYQVISAGYQGKDALIVERDAMEAAKASGADMALVAGALTSEMHAYNANVSQTGYYTDLMVEGVVRGAQSFQDFASAIGPLAAIASNVGISFNQVVAAEATMTQINKHVRQDANELQHLFNALALNTDAVAASAKKMGLSFDENKYKSLDLIGKLEYLHNLHGITKTDFEKLVGGASGMAAALALLSGNASAYTKNLQAMKDAHGATDTAFQASEQTIQSHLDHISAAFSILGTKLVQALTPIVGPILDRVSGAIGAFTDFITNHTQQALPVLAGLATLIGGTLVAAIVAFIGPMLMAAAPILGIVVAVAALVAGIIFLVQHWNQLLGAFEQHGPLSGVGSILHAIASFFVDTFGPVIQQFKDLWNQQLLPLFKQLWGAVQPLMPLLAGLAGLVGGILVIGLGLLVGALTGIIKGLAGFLGGVATVIGGVVQMITGAIQVISGIIRFFVDLVTGHFGALRGDLGVIWQGIINIFGGAWNTIKGIFQAAWGAISGFVSGLVQGVIGFFTHLKDVLVGHSIIPDMINGIIDFFGNLPGRVFAFVAQLVSNVLSKLGEFKDRALTAISTLITGIVNFFTSLPGKALKWGEDMIGGFINGIKNMIGGIGNAIGNIAGSIKHMLGFSKPDQGPLAEVDQWMPHFGDLLSAGITAQKEKLAQAAKGLAVQISATMTPTAPPSLSTQGVGLGAGGGLSTQLLAQLVALQQAQLQQGGRTSIGIAPLNANTGTVTQYNQFSLPGPVSAQILQQQLNWLAGRNNEYGLRGAPTGGP